MNRKFSACSFHEPVFVNGLGSIDKEVRTQDHSSRYKKIVLEASSDPALQGILITVTSNTGRVLEGFAPYTMLKYGTFLPEDPAPTPVKSNKSAA